MFVEFSFHRSRNLDSLAITFLSEALVDRKLEADIPSPQKLFVFSFRREGNLLDDVTSCHMIGRAWVGNRSAIERPPCRESRDPRWRTKSKITTSDQNYVLVGVFDT